MATRKILSIDGGGIRGIIPALILSKIESIKNKPVCELFDLIAGTSTGGIIALGLTADDGQGLPKFSAGEMANFYAEHGPEIFHRSFAQKLTSAGNLVDEKYSHSNIEALLDEKFEDCMLSDALTDVLITSYEIERRIPWFFKSRNAKSHHLKKDYDFRMADVARSTSAAPTYFEPKKIDVGGLADYWALIDGGVYANNPSMCAFVEAKKLYPDDDIVLVSLGTGQMTKRYDYKKVKDWGLVSWVQPLISMVFDGVSDTVHYQMTQLIPDSYYRFQIELPEVNDPMDDASPKNIKELKLLGERVVNERGGELYDICKML